MYEETSKPLVRRTRQTLRKAELGFFGVVVYTRVQTPRFCGEAARAGTLDFQAGSFRPVRINWVVVAINTFRGPSRYIEGPLMLKQKLRAHARHWGARETKAGDCRNRPCGCQG